MIILELYKTAIRNASIIANYTMLLYSIAVYYREPRCRWNFP